MEKGEIVALFSVFFFIDTTRLIFNNGLNYISGVKTLQILFVG